MTELLMILSLIGLRADLMHANAAQTVAQVRPCVWPHVCVNAAPVIAQVRPCKWPNVCGQTAGA